MDSPTPRRRFRWPWKSADQIAAEVDEEIAFHLDRRTEDLVAEGLSPAEARQQARSEFGDVDQARRELRRLDRRSEESRRRGDYLDELRLDVRFALRGLRKNLGFTAASVLMLSLGIGATATIFGLVNGVLLESLPYAEPDRLVAVNPGLSRAEHRILEQASRSFEKIALYQSGLGYTLSEQDRPERLVGAAVSPNLFTTLGATPIAGRSFLDEEALPGRTPVVVLSEDLWRRRFGGDADILDRTVSLDGVDHTVIGVMPAAFAFPAAGTELWTALSYDPEDLGLLWGNWGGDVVARLAPGVEAEAAQAEVRGFGDRLRTENPLWTPPAGYRADSVVTSLRGQLVGSLRPALLLLFGAVGFVLLIASANVGNMLLARGLERRPELAVRSALGASRGRIVRQLLTESVLLAIAGGVAGLMVGTVSLRLLVATLPADTPRLAEVGMDGRVLLFAFVVALVTGVACGLLPAWQGSRRRLARAARSGQTGAAGTVRQRRLAAFFVLAEVALAMVLVIGAGLLAKSLWQLLRIDPGFRTEAVVSARVSPPEQLYLDRARQRDFYGRLLERVRRLPGTVAVGATSQLPFDQEIQRSATSFTGGIEVDPNSLPMFDWRSVTPGYFAALGIPLERGRLFEEADDEGNLPVAIIDRAAAERFWPGADPIGNRLGRPWLREELTIVGVVGNVKNNRLNGEQMPAVYVPYGQQPKIRMTIAARTHNGMEPFAAALPGLVAEIDRSVPISDLATLDALVGGSVSRPRLTAILLALFAGVATVLAMIGVYSIIAYSRRQRLHELGVRLALGADRRSVVHLLLRQGAFLAVAGVAVGIGAALLLNRVLESLLYGVTATDPMIFVVVSVLEIAVILTASLVPARAAARIDPVRLLRSE